MQRNNLQSTAIEYEERIDCHKGLPEYLVICQHTCMHDKNSLHVVAQFYCLHGMYYYYTSRRQWADP